MGEIIRIIVCVTTVWLCVLVPVHAQRSQFQPIPSNHNQRGSLPPIIRIGGLFDDGGDPLEEVAFKHAVERVNSNVAAAHGTSLSSKIDRILPGNSFFANETTCRMLGEGVAFMIGPKNAETSCHVQSICDAFDMLHIETQWDFHICKRQRMVNLYPHPDTISGAIADLVEEAKWDKYVILYDDGLHRMERLLTTATSPPRKVLIRRLSGDDFRPILEEILNLEEFKNIIIDCDTFKTEIVMKQAQQVGLMNRQYNYILTTLDIHTMNLDDYKYGQIPIYAFRLVNPDRPEVQRVISDFNSLAGLDHKLQEAEILQSQLSLSSSVSWRDTHLTRQTIQRLISSSKAMPLNIALVYDALQLFGQILPKLDHSDKINAQALKCNGNERNSGHGTTLMNFMKTTQFEGLTGPISFGKSGYRTDIVMDVVELEASGITKMGTWSSETKFAWDPAATEGRDAEIDPNDDSLPISQRRFRVVTIVSWPFCMLKKNVSALSGNDRFEGYNIDLIQRLSEILNFKYDMELVYDGTSYGGYNETTKKWDGMIREILDKTAHIAVGDLAINKIRQTAVDFTMPHMNLGISILYVTPMAKPPGLLSFMSPFGADVWMCTLLSFCGVALTMFIIARVSPKEWDCPMPCIQNPTKLHNQFSLSNSIWFAVGSIMQQGSDIAPKATSTRIVGAIWWFFTLIMVSSYTAGLALFLIVQDKDDSIKDLKDLVDQDKVKYGCVQRGSTRNFFKDAHLGTTVHDAYLKMEKMFPTPYMEKNIDGVNRVKNDKGKYAFFMESTLIDYNIEIECGLAQLGGLLDNKGYGIVLPKNSTYLSDFNGAILQLQERGELTDFKRKWWKEKINPPACEGSGVGGNVEALALANVGGVFVVLVVGCFVALLVSIGEFFWGWKQQSAGLTDTLAREEMLREMKFAMQFTGTVKVNPYYKPPEESTKSGVGSENISGKGSMPFLDEN